MYLSEEEVYVGAKRWLQNNGFIVLAGQPARGVDHLPVIEIKLPTGDKGSQFSYKPDLVAFKDNVFYIIECKPKYDLGDHEKLISVLTSDERKNNFYIEMEQYGLLERISYEGTKSDFCTSLKGVLAFSGQDVEDDQLNRLLVDDWKGIAEWK